MKKYVCILLAILMALAALSGCQQTPKDDLVVGKDMSKMLKKAMAPQDVQGGLPEVLGIPSGHYETNLEDKSGKIKVTVDADINLPDADSIPIVRVAAKPFSQDTVNTLIELLFDDGPLYTPESISELTKTDIIELLVRLKQKKAELEAQGMEPEKSDSIENEASASGNGSSSNEEVAVPSSMNQLAEVIESIEFFEQMLETAPDENTYAEATGELHAQDISGMSEEVRAEYEGKLFEIADVGQLNQNGGMSSLFVVNNERSNSYSIHYVNRRDYEATTGNYYSEEQWSETAEEAERMETEALTFPAMTEEDAKVIADEFLNEIRLDYLDCTLVERVVGGSSVYYTGGIRSGNLIKAYRLQYVRKVKDVPLTYTNVEGSWDDTDSSNAWMWSYEKMTLIIDDSGIVEMVWEAPYELKETVTETTAMLPFSRIQDIFEKMIIVNNADHSEYGMELNITGMKLGLARITEQNNLKSGLLIPVWDFFGTATYHYGDGESESHTVIDSGESYLTINAIDGSIVDRGLGY